MVNEYRSMENDMKETILLRIFQKTTSPYEEEKSILLPMAYPMLT